MSVTAINPNGVVTRFNDACYIRWDLGGGIGLFTGNPDRGGRFVARVLRDWIVSFDQPCSVEHHGKPPAMTLHAALDIVLAGVESLARERAYRIADLKLALRQFNAHTKTWRTS